MKKIKTAYLTSAIGCLVVVIGIVCYFLFAGIAKNDGVSYLYIDDDDDMNTYILTKNVSPDRKLRHYSLSA